VRKLTVADVNAAIKRHLKPENLSVFTGGDFARTPSSKTAAVQ
jgi:predicted Zn-dependent peptidase